MSEESAKITPEVIQAMKGIETVEVLVEILKGQKYLVPVGIVENPGPYTVTYPNPVTIECLPTNWFSFSLFNDGKGSVCVQVEASLKVGMIPLRPHEVLSGESYNVDMHAPLIRSIYLTVAVGTTARVRISGVR